METDFSEPWQIQQHEVLGWTEHYVSFLLSAVMGSRIAPHYDDLID